MTHSFMYVILPKSISDVKDTDKIKEAVEQLMLPYNEEDSYEKGPDGEYQLKKGSDPRWDWYSIGGRWNGIIRGQERSSADGFNFDDEYREVPENVCLVKDINMQWYPSDVLTPDGEWIADGKAGWFGMREHEDGQVTGPFDDEEKPSNAWNTKVKALLDEYADHLVVGVDYHI
jgi:hypothetical protein